MTARAEPLATPPATYAVQGREVRLPVEVRDASAAVAYYLVRAREAQALIASSGLRVAQVLPGRALCTIGTMEYRDGDLGPYREIAVTFFVHEAGSRRLPLVSAMAGLVRTKLPTYIHRLPVDSEFSREAGVAIWGFPKFMSQIDIAASGETQTSTLRVDGKHVLTHTVRTGGRRAFGEREQVSYAYRDATLFRTPALMAGEAVGVRLGGARLEPGEHALADELRSLGLPKRPLMTTTIGRMRGRFFAAHTS